MPSPVPVPGSSVRIREARWRVEAVRRELDVLRLDVINGSGRRTFLVPFDRVERGARRARVRPARAQHVRARLAAWLQQAADSRRLPAAVGATVDLLPHQLEPALAILGGARRVLIADDVGLGKTIQAAFVLAELLRHHPCLRALILVRASLRAQWAQELERRFGIRPIQADAAGLHHLAHDAARSEEV